MPNGQIPCNGLTLTKLRFLDVMSNSQDVLQEIEKIECNNQGRQTNQLLWTGPGSSVPKNNSYVPAEANPTSGVNDVSDGNCYSNGDVSNHTIMTTFICDDLSMSQLDYPSYSYDEPLFTNPEYMCSSENPQQIAVLTSTMRRQWSRKPKMPWAKIISLINLCI